MAGDQPSLGLTVKLLWQFGSSDLPGKQQICLFLIYQACQMTSLIQSSNGKGGWKCSAQKTSPFHVGEAPAESTQLNTASNAEGQVCPHPVCPDATEPVL